MIPIDPNNSKRPNDSQHLVLTEDVTVLTHDMIPNKDIVEITLPSSLRRIDDKAFQSCGKLSKVNMEEGLESIGDFAFRECYGLKSLCIPNSVVRLGEYSMPFNIQNITLPQGLEYLPRGVFHSCGSLQEVHIPNKVKSIGSYAFLRCENLVNVVFSSALEEIHTSAFSGCESLIHMSPLKGVKLVENDAFKGCVKLKTLLVERVDCELDYWAFDGCLGLEFMVLPDPLPLLSILKFPYQNEKPQRHITVCAIQDFQTWLARMDLDKRGYDERDLAMLYQLSRRVDYICSWEVLRARHPDVLMEDLLRVLPVAKRGNIFPKRMLSYDDGRAFPDSKIRHMLLSSSGPESAIEVAHLDQFLTIGMYAALMRDRNRVILFPGPDKAQKGVYADNKEGVLELSHMLSKNIGKPDGGKLAAEESADTSTQLSLSNPSLFRSPSRMKGAAANKEFPPKPRKP